ncbi:MAG: Ig-like domain-containing protein, partial [Limnoraphis robusta]
GSVNLNENGSFSYTPNSGFSGVDSFTYTANDGESNSNIATVTIDVEYTRSLNGYSQRGEDQAQVFKTFFITNVGNNDQIINDQDDSDTIGFFPEAIENFIAYETIENGLSTVITVGSRSSDYSDDRGRINFDEETQIRNFDDDGNIIDEYATLSFDEEGAPIFTGLNIDIEDINPVDLDLRVRLVEEETVVYEFLDSETKIVETLIFPGGLNSVPNKPLSLNLATNSLEYIIKQNLLLYTESAENSSVEFTLLEETELPPPEERTYSQRNDKTTVLTTFLLTNNGNNYQTIEDQDDSDTRSLFPNAIQDFVTYNNESGIALAADEYGFTPRINFNGETELFEGGTTLSFNEEGEPIFTGVEVETEIIPAVDLRVSRLIERDDISAELGLPDDTEIDDSFQGEIIVYEFLEEELFLFTNEFPDLEEEFVFTDDSLYQSAKINLATNSLESIIEEDLLSFTLEKPDAIQVVLGEITPSEGRSSGEGFVNPER